MCPTLLLTWSIYPEIYSIALMEEKDVSQYDMAKSHAYLHMAAANPDLIVSYASSIVVLLFF